MPRLRISNLSKSFSDKKILDNVSFETKDGELVVVLGPSGCGKTTLLRLLTGLETPDEGEVWIGDRRIDKLPPRKRNIALVFQNYALYPHMTVEENLSFPLRIARVPKREIRDRVLSTSTLIGLSDRLKAKPSELSGGQRQRVALGRAIIRKPDLCLFDEPLSNLDADLRTRMRRELVEIQKSLGTTTVYVTHDQVEALTMADRLIILNEGYVIQSGTVDEIYNHPANTFVASFVGTPKMNFVEGFISGNLIKPFNLSTVLVPSDYNLREIVLGVRPEDIIVGQSGQFNGKVKSVEYLGDRSILTLKYLTHDITVVVDSNRYKGDQIEINQPLAFGIDKDRIYLFHKNTGLRLK